MSGFQKLRDIASRMEKRGTSADQIMDRIGSNQAPNKRSLKNTPPNTFRYTNARLLRNNEVLLAKLAKEKKETFELALFPTT